MAMRAQLSLIFTDENLFKNFIEPSKQNRELHGIVHRCLSAYFYNEQVRNLIEGYSAEEVLPEGVKVSSSQENIDNIRQLLAMQSFLGQELQNVMEDGVEDFSNMLDGVNKTAEERGFVRSTDSDYSERSYQAVSITSKTPLIGMTQENTAQANKSSSQGSAMEDKVNLLFEFFSSNPAFMDFVNSRGVASSVDVQYDAKNESQIVTNEVRNDASSIDKDFDAFEANMTTKVEEEPVANLGEAADAMADLLSSLHAQ